MATETVTWASIGSAGSWVASSGTLLSCVQTEGNGTHGIEPTSTSAMFGVPADFTAGAGETVNSVTIRAVMRVATAGDSCQVANMLRVGGGSNVTHPTTALVDTTVFTEYEWVWTTQPSGAAWTVAAANDIARCYVDPSLSALGGALHLDVIQVTLDYGAASSDATVTPPPLTLAVTFPAPTVSGAGKVAPPALATTLGFPEPEVGAGSRVAGEALPLILSLPAPAVSADAIVSVPALPFGLTLPEPSAWGEVAVTGETLSLTLGFPAPVVSAGGTVTVQPPTLPVVLEFPEPAVSGVQNGTVQPPAMALSVGLPPPGVTASGSATVLVPALDLAVTLPVPTILARPGLNVTIGSARPHRFTTASAAARYVAGAPRPPRYSRSSR